MSASGIVLLGSTGSIGTQTLDVIRSQPGRFKVVGLAAGTNRELLARQVRELDVPFASCASGPIDVGGVQEIPMEELVLLPGVDLVIVATGSTRALHATLGALAAGRSVATANKEVLVAAGELVMAAAHANGARVLPIDSEHSAIWQCMRGEDATAIDTIVLTASGGAFRDVPLDELPNATPAAALRHPVWQMGAKVTIDAATLANKAFEVVEAHWLFDLPYERIEVVMHRQSIVHSFVQFVDGSSKAQLGLPDMRLPIQYALTYPERVPGRVRNLDLTSLGALSFEPVDPRRYPAFDLIIRAARAGGTYPAAVSAANDEAVDAFLRDQIPFTQIAEALGATLDTHDSVAHPALGDVIEAEERARRQVRDWLGKRLRTAAGA